MKFKVTVYAAVEIVIDNADSAVQALYEARNNIEFGDFVEERNEVTYIVEADSEATE